ncbi:MAG: Photosystem II manganese-stabilizing polypeptide [Oscillatoria sp. SIO1A7]|nr:Photosystem II manganese-stabilizing polypeptide [Oscillatoria sp. SIO1A7]
MRFRALIVALLGLCFGLLAACGEGPSTSSDLLTYKDIVNTGLANNCPTLPESARGEITLDSSLSYSITDLCMQPTEYFVEEEPANKRDKAEFVPSKILTRKTSSLTQISGPLKINSDGSFTFIEKQGIDFQATTVMLPGGEEVPFLFTVKKLVANSQPGLDSINTSTDFKGKFKVPSYRSAGFLDPKGRGGATGYDNAVALPASADDKDLIQANVKRAKTLEGEVALEVTKIDPSTGEIAGIFDSEQPSDTDLGAKAAVKVKIRGNFYARIEEDLS